ncbi:PilN domain-containing protein [Phormidium sp. FACHB-1136]|uniref:PilN domain-containing protein n=1 Tax=Phormidium sp. FACHB-1136 TaxID=2692848 RepID=UPI001687A02B|nr:PilN domain-containing protein [Phormidium sp. FACHB-1136]MBD2424595.1 PilN domain-containing protein [Phormidium sp. FACHB-1136]
MYSLDINFLKDREPRVYEAKPKARGGGDGGGAAVNRGPLIYGLLGALVPIGLAGAYWLVSQGQLRQLQARKVNLESELAQIQAQLAELGNLQGQIDAVRAENNAFVGVFNDIVPWSALLEDIRDRTPTRIQITNISQDGGSPLPSDPSLVPPRAGGVLLQGVACSFDDVNDFALILGRSPLLQGATVAITEATQQSELLDPAVDGRCPGTPPNTPTYLVDYTIRANITNTPSAQLIDELERQGAVGLVTRLRALREEGVIE